MSIVTQIPPGTRGFDCNDPITYSQARRFVESDKQYRFVARYVPRHKPASHDLTDAEVATLLSAGLAVTPVQHVELPDWIPSIQKAILYGKIAADYALDCGILPGSNLWLDLEEVDKNVPELIIIQYCNTWYDYVSKIGFVPGIYVGYKCGLDANDLYYRLRFKHYWVAYNLNRDEWPIVRGPQMKQGVATYENGDYPNGVNFQIDTDIVIKDMKGGLPLVTAPDEWDV